MNKRSIEAPSDIGEPPVKEPIEGANDGRHKHTSSC